MAKYRQIKIDGDSISVYMDKELGEFVSLSNLSSVFAPNNPDIIKSWLNNKQTLELLGVWEQSYNKNFGHKEFKSILSNISSKTITPRNWIKKTKAIGLSIKTGKNAGIYAHKELVFEFGTYINPLFKLLMLREFTRLREVQTPNTELDWLLSWLADNFDYLLAKETIGPSEYVIPVLALSKSEQNKWLEEATELDMIQVALFGFTSEMWEESNPDLLKEGLSIDNVARISDFFIIENLKRVNQRLMELGVNKKDRFKTLLGEAKSQQQMAQFFPNVHTIKKEGLSQKEKLSSFNERLTQALKFNPNKS